jgi:hypothetical protein
MRPSFDIRALMSYSFISKNSFVILASGGGPHVSTRVRRPTVQASHHVAVVGVVIRMLVRDEDVTQHRQRHASEGKLTGHTITAVDHVRGAIADDHLSRPRGRLPRTRTASGAEKNQLGGAILNSGR